MRGVNWRGPSITESNLCRNHRTPLRLIADTTRLQGPFHPDPYARARAHHEHGKALTSTPQPPPNTTATNNLDRANQSEGVTTLQLLLAVIVLTLMLGMGACTRVQGASEPPNSSPARSRPPAFHPTVVAAARRNHAYQCPSDLDLDPNLNPTLTLTLP